MALRPELDEQIRSVERLARDSSSGIDRLLEDLNEKIEAIEAVPDEVWDNISVVNHTIELRREARRVRRESGLPPLKH